MSDSQSHRAAAERADAVCPSCGAPDSRRLFERHGHWICHCDRCEHRFTPIARGRLHVADVYADGYFTEGGAGYPDYLAEEALLVEAGQRYGELLARRAPAGSILDIGSAAGFILKGLTNAGWIGRGIEPNERMAAHARERVGVDVRAGTLEDITPGEQFDAISMIQVIAHFYDLRRALENAVRLTRPGGLWIVETWDYGSLLARLLGRRWHEYSPPSVVHWFTRASLAGLLRTLGLVEIAHGRPRKRIAVAHAKALLEHKLGRWGRLLPNAGRDGSLPYPSFDVFWAIYRKDESR